MNEIKLVGNNIRRIRLENRWSLQDVAKLSGISVTRWKSIEKGQTKIRLTTLVKIVITLDTSFSELLAKKISK